MRQTIIRKLTPFLTVAAITTAAIVIHFWGAQIGPSMFIEHMVPGLISDESWRRSIAKDPTSHGYSAYGVLQDRKSKCATNEAIRDLQSPDPYVWFNAALYLGELRDPAAVPYLIKGLRHPAYRAHGEVAAQLHAITNQSFGKSFQKWKQWWENQNPNTTFDFDIDP